MYVPRLRGSWPSCWLLWKGVIFQDDDALEEIGKRPSRGQSCHPGPDNDGLFPDERGHRNLFQIFLERQSELKRSNHTPAKKEWRSYRTILDVLLATPPLTEPHFHGNGCAAGPCETRK